MCGAALAMIALIGSTTNSFSAANSSDRADPNLGKREEADQLIVCALFKKSGDAGGLGGSNDDDLDDAHLDEVPLIHNRPLTPPGIIAT